MAKVMVKGKESKTQKVSRVKTDKQVQKKPGTCQCGGDLIWAQVVTNRSRMMKVCEKCGALHERDNT